MPESIGCQEESPQIGEWKDALFWNMSELIEGNFESLQVGEC
jgi:hypothetical protein